MPGRDNGFVARHYVPLADLDPRLADAMLEALRAEGIAAYVVPSTGQLGGYLEVHLPERPRDRLWVDRRHHDRASTLLNVHGDRPDLIAAATTPDQLDDGGAGGGKMDGGGRPEGHPDDHVDGAPFGGDSTDDVWAQIVAGFDLPTNAGAGPWPLADRTFDAVVVTNYLWRPLLPAIVATVGPGGALLYETFAVGNATVGRPANPDFLLAPGELLVAAAGLRIVAYEDGFLADPDRFVQRLAAVREQPSATPPRHPLGTAALVPGR